VQVLEVIEDLEFKLLLDSKTYKFGKLALIGLPNTGKSSLINSILNEKLFAVSAKAQTTRHALNAVYTDNEAQIVFIDTPGYHDSNKLLNQFFISQLNKSIKKANIIILLISSDEKLKDQKQNLLLLESLRKAKKNIIYCVSKADLLKDKNNFIEAKKKLYTIDEDITLLSIKNKNSIKELLFKIKQLLEEGEAVYDKDYITDKSIKFLSTELIREKIFRFAQDELPYSTTVEIIKYIEEKSIHKIYANIVVERDSQKAILIGKNGMFLKKIGVEARKDIENLCQNKVYLELFVKVKKNWTSNKQYLKELDYDT